MGDASIQSNRGYTLNDKAWENESPKVAYFEVTILEGKKPEIFAIGITNKTFKVDLNATWLIY